MECWKLNKSVSKHIKTQMGLVDTGSWNVTQTIKNWSGRLLIPKTNAPFPVITGVLLILVWRKYILEFLLIRVGGERDRQTCRPRKHRQSHSNQQSTEYIARLVPWVIFSGSITKSRVYKYIVRLIKVKVIGRPLRRRHAVHREQRFECC